MAHPEGIPRMRVVQSSMHLLCNARFVPEVSGRHCSRRISNRGLATMKSSMGLRNWTGMQLECDIARDSSEYACFDGFRSRRPVVRAGFMPRALGASREV